MYSLDLSGAFDMLRKYMLARDLAGLINVICNFLSNQKLFVNVGMARSKIYDLDRGCPQGS